MCLKNTYKLLLESILKFYSGGFYHPLIQILSHEQAFIPSASNSINKLKNQKAEVKF